MNILYWSISSQLILTAMKVSIVKDDHSVVQYTIYTKPNLPNVNKTI